VAARAMWKGALTMPGVRLPVKLYSAVQDQKVRFHLLHDKDLARVEQRMVDPEEGRQVPYEKIRKGLVTESGVVVALDEEEIASLAPEASRDVELLRFVPVGAIDHPWYDRPYWLGPDGDEGAYAALATALRKKEREGVARWVMRGRGYVGALRAEGDHLLLITLRRAGEVVGADELPAPGGRDLDAREKKLAEQLVSALADHFDPADYRDTFRHRLRELIAAKAEGKPIKLKKFVPRKEPASLEQALAASLAKAKEPGGGKAGSGARSTRPKRGAAKRAGANGRRAAGAAKRQAS
jgi:DNA end-binding protein Ku